MDNWSDREEILISSEEGWDRNETLPISANIRDVTHWVGVRIAMTKSSY